MRPRLITVTPGPAGLQQVLPAVRRLLDGSDDRIAVVPQARDAATARQVRAVAPEDPLAPGTLVLATSGSTGDPVGVTLPAEALRASAQAFTVWSRAGLVEPGRPLRWLASLPLTSIGGLMCLVRSLSDGGEPEATPWLGGGQRFTATALIEITERVVGSDTGWAISLVPTMLARVLAEDSAAVAALSRFNVVLVGGAALGCELAGRAHAAGIRIVTSYGMTETCGGAVMNGRPLPGVTVQAIPWGRTAALLPEQSSGVQVGQLQISGPVVAAGYRDGRLRESWVWDAVTGQRGFRTSDLGSVAESGEVEVLARIDDVVQVGGLNVATNAVGAVLSEHPSVREAEVAAAPDPDWGARLVGFVVVSADSAAMRPALRAELRTLVGARLGRLAVPADIRFCSDLPRLPGGKTDRAALARMAQEPATEAADESCVRAHTCSKPKESDSAGKQAAPG